MCVPCIIIASGCGTGNNAANSFINANEQFAEAIRYMADHGTLGAQDGERVKTHCARYSAIAKELDLFTADTIALTIEIAKRTPNP